MAGAKGESVISSRSSAKKSARILQLVQPVARQQGSGPKREAAQRGERQLPFEEIIFVAVDLLGHNAAG